LRKVTLLIILTLFGLLVYKAYPYYQLYKAKGLNNIAFEANRMNVTIEDDILFNQLGVKLFHLGVIKDVDAFNILVDYKNYTNDTLKKGKIAVLSEWDNNTMVNQLFLMRNQGIIDLTVVSVSNLEELAGNVSNLTSIDSLSLLILLKDKSTHSKYGFNKDQFMTMFIPNTFEIFSSISETEFIQLMADYYKTFWNDSRRQKATNIGLSQPEVYTLASIVQMEQQVRYDEHSKIAGLYINRLNINMKLQADPTVKFANKLPKLRRVLNRHLKYDSPYNTYLYNGLPPGPICIPDDKTIDAVLNYVNHDYIYMCAQPTFSGYHNFATTYGNHMKNYRLYKSWLEKNKIK
jgi:UPF0755 protein